MDFLSVFAERLKGLMNENNLNVALLHQKTGLKENNIWNWTAKKFMPSTSHMITISSFFNCSIDFLVGRSELPEIISTDLTSSFKERFSLLRREKEKSLYAVASALNTDNTIIYRWGNGKFIPNMQGLIMLADYFGCSIDYLIGRNN